MISWRKWFVREKLAAANLTIEKAAELVGVERRTLGAAINGQREPSLSETVALARLLNVKVEELLEGDPSPLRPKDRRATIPASGGAVVLAAQSVARAD